MANRIEQITLSKNQKVVLAKIVGAPTPKVAADDISNSGKMIAARQTCIKLGLIDYQSGEVSLTEKGAETAASENITDESGSLTDIGTKLAAHEEVKESFLSYLTNSF